MANTNNPFGFQPYDPRAGTLISWGLTPRKIRSGNATAIYRGDPVAWGTSSDAGYIVQGAAGATVPGSGIMWGAHYYNSAMKIPFQSPYWAGSGASGDVYPAFVVNAPNAMFLVQSGNSSGTATPVAASQVGLNADFAVGTGSTVNGLSGAYLDITTIATTATLPFRIVQLASDFLAPGANGSDSTTAYNWVVVEFNPQLLPA